MADQAELRIVLLDPDGAEAHVQSLTPGAPAQSASSMSGSPFVLPTSPATVTAPPQQPIVFSNQQISQPITTQTFSASPPPVTFSFPQPQQPEERKSQSINENSRETKDIYSLQAQPINAQSRMTSDYYTFRPEPAPAPTPQIPQAISALDEARKILEKRRWDEQVQSELNRLDPPKPKLDRSAATSAYAALGQGAASMGLQRTSRTLRGAADVAARGGGVNPEALAATVALDAFTDATKGAAIGLHEISAATSLMARGQNFAAVARVADDAAAAIGKIPYAGGALQAMLEAASFAVKGFAGTVQAFIDRGKELARFSPDIAQAGAVADIRSLRGDIREAQILGPSLRRLTELQSEGSDQLREILLPMKKAIIEDISGTLVFINAVLEKHGPAIALYLVSLCTSVEIIADLLRMDFASAVKAREALGQRMADAMNAMSNRHPAPDPAEFVIGKLMEAAKINLGQRQQKPPAQPAPKSAFLFP